MINQTAPVLQRLRDARRVLLVTHENPDGDAIGALLALTLALQGQGKTAVPYDVHPMPGYLAWLPGAALLTHTADPTQFDAVCILDCGAADRMGPLAAALAAHPNVVNIDHHATNNGYGHANFVDPAASSTCEILTRLLPELGVAFTPDIATLLYLGIYTDTTMFQNSAANPRAYYACGDLVTAGADFLSVARRVYIDSKAGRLLLLGRVLSTLELHADGLIAGMVCPRKHLDELGLTPDEMETFVEYPRSIIGVQAAYLLREVDGLGLVKGSLRSVGDLDVSAIAQTFGGGGHKKAAGFRATGTLAEVRAQLVELLTKGLGKA
jgi:bifunctional oligoribonuclease and PAP phosphatase NrnA